jgi:hypothetical protein
MDSDQPTRPVRPASTSYVSAPFLWIDWICQWIAYLASNLAIFRVLEYVGKLGILVTVIWWIAEYPERQREAIRTAWSVVNTKGGGRLESLKYLAERNVDLKGLYAGGGYFSGIALEDRDLSWSNLDGANFETSHLDRAHLEGSALSGTDFKNATLVGANFQNARLSPSAPMFDGADIGGADFRNIVVMNAQGYLAFAQARNWKNAQFGEGVKEFIECMMSDDKATSSCQPKIPEIEGLDPLSGQQFVHTISFNIWCELHDAFSRLRKDYPAGTPFDTWNVEMNLSLAYDEQQPIASGLLFVPAIPKKQNSAATTNTNLSANTTATRVQKIDQYYLVSDLEKVQCGEDARPHGAGLLGSDLKLAEWLYDEADVMTTRKLWTVGHSDDRTNSLQHEVKFATVIGGPPGSTGGAMPSVADNSNGSSISVGRAQTYDLLITLAPKRPS